MKFQKHKYYVLILQLLIYILLDITYVWVISDLYAYDGYPYQFNLERFIIGGLTVVAISLFLAKAEVSQFIYAFLSLMLIFLVYPSTILFKYSDATPLILISHILLFLSVSFFSHAFKKRVKLPSFNEQKSLRILLILCVIAIIPFIYVYGPYLNLKNLFLMDIYESRAIQKKISGPYTGYMYSWLSRVMLPILLVLAFRNKKWKTTWLVFGLLIFLFLCGAHKSVFMTSFILIVFYFNDYYKKLYYFLLLISIYMVGALFIYGLSDDYMLISLVNRRAFIVPALLDVKYFEFFDNNHLYYSWSFLGSFLEYPYDMNPAHVIGREAFGRPNMGANNGIISEGFMNMGILGIGINIFLISLFLAYLNNLKIHHRFFGVYFAFFISMMSSYLPVILLTHGGIVLLLCSQIFLKGSANWSLETNGIKKIKVDN